MNFCPEHAENISYVVCVVNKIFDAVSNLSAK